MKRTSLFLPLILLSLGCSNDSKKGETVINESKSQTKLVKENDSIKELESLQSQFKSGNYSQLENFIAQIKTFKSKHANNLTKEEQASFPELSKSDLIDFFKAIDLKELKGSGNFEKKYSFGSAPKEYKPDSEECPDLLNLSIDSETGVYTLSQNNSYLVDEEIGCAESSTIYSFKIKNGRPILEKVDYAG